MRTVRPYVDQVKDWSSGQPRKIFSLSGWILRALPEESDRETLSRRLVNKLTGRRRGRLYLPRHFPPEVARLSNMTVSQLRQTVYWLKAGDGADLRITNAQANFALSVLPEGRIRTVYGDNSVHVRQRGLVGDLPASEWPRLGTRALWPSSPTVPELLQMSRRGKTARPMDVKSTVGRALNPISLAEQRSNPDLCKRIVTKNVLGIRSDVKIPDKYLGHFRYRWNFLILTSRHNPPIGLARFLTAQWIRMPHNLWLLDKSSFRSYLKKTDRARFPCGRPGPW